MWYKRFDSALVSWLFLESTFLPKEHHHRMCPNIWIFTNDVLIKVITDACFRDRVRRQWQLEKLRQIKDVYCMSLHLSLSLNRLHLCFHLFRQALCCISTLQKLKKEVYRYATASLSFIYFSFILTVCSLSLTLCSNTIIYTCRALFLLLLNEFLTPELWQPKERLRNHHWRAYD